MTNKYIADADDIPSSYNLQNDKSKRLMADIMKTRKEEERAEVVKAEPSMKKEYQYEDDFDQARRNIATMLATANKAVEEYFEMAVTTDSPRAFEVLGQMIKSTVEMNKDLLDIHQQREKLNKTKNEVAHGSGDGHAGVVNNTQNNIVLTPTDLVEMLKNGGVVDTPGPPDEPE